MVYRAMGDTTRKTIRPRGLRTGATYRVRFTDRRDELALTSEALAHEGTELELAELSSEMIHLELI
jgi:hypothetical protein